MPLDDSRGTIRPMMQLALPVFVSQSLILIVGYTDWWLTGHYLTGSAPKAAMGLMAYYMWMLQSLFSVFQIGATALVARFTGARQHRRAERVLHQALVAGFALSCVATLASSYVGDSFVHLMQLEDEAAVLAAQYIWIVTPVIPAIMVLSIGSSCLSAAGDTVTGALISALAVVINVLVGASLVIGWGPIPQLGWRGLPIGTLTAEWTAALIMCCTLIRGRAGMRLRLRQMRPHATTMRRLLRIGIPGGIDIATMLGCQLGYFAIIGTLGTVATAAHGLGVQVEALAYLPGHAFSIAASTLTGQYLGAGKPQQATRCALTCCLAGGSFMTFVGLGFFFKSDQITFFFTGNSDDPAGVLAAQLLQIAAVSMPFLATMMILSGALRGAGDTRWTLMTTALGLILVRIPGACWLAWYGVRVPGTDWVVAGVIGAWVAMVADVAVRGLLLLGRFYHGGWRTIKV